MRLLLTRDGAYRLLRRNELPYLLVYGQARRGPVRRRIAVSPRTLHRMMVVRLSTARQRGRWTAEDCRDFGLT